MKNISKLSKNNKKQETDLSRKYEPSLPEIGRCSCGGMRVLIGKWKENLETKCTKCGQTSWEY